MDADSAIASARTHTSAMQSASMSRSSMQGASIEAPCLHAEHLDRCTALRGPYTQSSGVATVLLDSREVAIKALFSKDFPNSHFEDWHLVLLIVLTFALTVATYGCDIPAGLFIPNIMIGACCGRLVGQIAQRMAIGYTVSVNPGVYARDHDQYEPRAVDHIGHHDLQVHRRQFHSLGL